MKSKKEIVPSTQDRTKRVIERVESRSTNSDKDDLDIGA